MVPACPAASCVSPRTVHACPANRCWPGAPTPRLAAHLPPRATAPALVQGALKPSIWTVQRVLYNAALFVAAACGAIGMLMAMRGLGVPV